jgi:hypothetical protein
MSYSGTTAASSVANPPLNLLRPMAQITNASGNVLGSSLQNATTSYYLQGGCGLWYYCSSDASTLLQAAGYFTDGQQLGMRMGDILINVVQTSLGTSPTFNIGVLMTTNSTAGWNIPIGAALASS